MRPLCGLREADFSMQCIEILQPPARPISGSIKVDHKRSLEAPMKSECPTNPMAPYGKDELTAPASRLLDEKISNNSDSESRTDSALKPAGLKNPFWK
jgi:hypothetical protein